MRNKFIIGSVTALCALSLAASALTVISTAYAQDQSYYVCFSNQNYSVRNANKMTLSNGEYVLENVSLSSAVDFYVTDNSGTRWYGANNSPVKTDENGVYAYDILFSPNDIYPDTDCHVSYRFYEPASYSIDIDGGEHELAYNPYNTAYDLYYISSAELSAGAQVRYGDETHTVSENGYYRILFTPAKTMNGKDYMFDENGNYGSGDGHEYRLYIEDAPRYFVVFDNAAPNARSETIIDGKTAHALTRYENNVTAAEYRSPEFFAPERDFGVKYKVYETGADGTTKLIDDDNNKDTAVSKLTATDVGYYALSFYDGGETYLSMLTAQEKDFGGYYIASEIDGYCYDADGNIDTDGRYAFAEVDDGNDDYDEDFKQYIAYLTVTDGMLENGDFEFYITNGKKKFKDGGDYITLSIAGKYKILCSEEHNYGRGRNFRYILEANGTQSEEITIGTAAEFIAFANNCQSSADYSIGLKVYLTADIDFDGVEFVPVGTFSGTLYGGYHILKNIKTSANVFETLTHTASIERLSAEGLSLGDKNKNGVGFIGVNYGAVKYVNVSGKVTGKTDVGGIVAVNGRSETDTGDSGDAVNKARIDGCTADVEINGQSYIGGICGRNTGDISSCSVYGNVKGGKSHSATGVDRIGGIAGYSLGKIYDCKNRATVTGGADSRYVGGIVGLCVGEIYFCFNSGKVSADKFAGGIVGYYGFQNADSSSIIGGGSQDVEAISGKNILNYIVNNADVTATAYAGGVVGSVLTSSGNTVRTLEIFNASSAGNIEASAGSYAGGIAGYSVGADIKSCMSTGSIKAKSASGGNYSGGIVGYGGDVRYSMSAAAVSGDNYIGGIAGYAAGDIAGCYTNTLLVAATDAEHTGEIAGFASGFDVSSNQFNTNVKCNYYIGNNGGIDGKQYADNFGFAAVKVDVDTLASIGTLSPVLGEDFSREYWQSGKDELAYPVLRNFENADICDKFGDDELFATLFRANVEMFTQTAYDAARMTYTVTFAEWNKNNGDLYDDGVLQTDNFDIISSVRAAFGQTVTAAPVYAQNVNGEYVYEGSEAKYYVSFPDTAVTRNITVYAEYIEMITSLDGDRAFVEGEFKKGTTAHIVNVGDYFTVEILYNGQKIETENVTVKFFVGDRADKFRVLDGNGNTVTSSVSGKYICFEFTSGEYFTAVENISALPYWAWLLIGIGSAALVAGLTVMTVLLIKRKKSKNVSAKKDKAEEENNDRNDE